MAGRAWPARGACDADVWQEATLTVHVGARVGRHVAAGGWHMEGPRVSGPWLDFWGGNAICVSRPLIYRSEECFFLPCGTMSHTGLSFAGHVDAQGMLDRIKRRRIGPRRSQGGDQSEERLIRQISLFRVTRGTPAEEAAANRKKGRLFRRLIRQRAFKTLFFRNNGRW